MTIVLCEGPIASSGSQSAWQGFSARPNELDLLVRRAIAPYCCPVPNDSGGIGSLISDQRWSWLHLYQRERWCGPLSSDEVCLSRRQASLQCARCRRLSNEAERSSRPRQAVGFSRGRYHRCCF